MEASKPRFPGQRTYWSRNATVRKALSPEKGAATRRCNAAVGEGAAAPCCAASDGTQVAIAQETNASRASDGAGKVIR